MPFSAQRCAAVLLCLCLLCVGINARAGVTAYAEPGQTDFDTALQTINPYGTWSKIGGQWAYTPFDHLAPYTDGRWIYTEYGWYWKGNLPHSWVTEHYGYWKRGANHIWSWFPGTFWLPEIVEIRSTSSHIGWRSAPVNTDGNFIEKPEARWAKTDEWTFVTLEQFANPITPALVAKPAENAGLLEDSVDSQHTYLTYREIDRPGPHPADLVKLCRDGGMCAPLTLQDKLALQQAPPPLVIPGVTPGTTLTDTNVNVAPIPPAPPAPSGLAQSAGAAPPPAVKAAPDSSAPEQDTRKVKYWVTRCLPTFWTPPPPEAKPDELYIYRPDFYQDEDGIARRISLWLDPNLLRNSKHSLADLLGGNTSPGPAAPSATNTGPVTPAEPVESQAPAKREDPFRNAFDDTYHGGGPPRSAAESSKNAAPAPGTNAPVPPPLGTNAAPGNLP